MKFIKLFENFKGQNILDDIKDICLELTDIGFVVNFEKYKIFADTNIHLIKIRRPYANIDGRTIDPVEFEFDEIEDVALRLVDFLGDKYRNYKFVNVRKYLFGDMNDISKAGELGKFTGFDIKWEEQIEVVEDINESKVQDKIELLQDLALVLKDDGLDVKIYSGSVGGQEQIYSDKNSICVEISYKDYHKGWSPDNYLDLDEDGQIVDKISNNNFRELVKEFIDESESFGLKARSITSGFYNYRIKYDKWGTMTKSPYLEDKYKITESLGDDSNNDKFKCGYDSFLKLGFTSDLKTSVLKGELIIDIKINKNNTELLLIVEGHAEYDLYLFYPDDPYDEDNVTIDDIEGDLSDLIDQPLLQAEESSNKEYYGGKQIGVWTFYKFASINGYITIKWFRISPFNSSENSYYSEKVTLSKVGGISREKLEEIYIKIS